MLVWLPLGRAHRRNSVAPLFLLLGMIFLLPQSAGSTDSNNFVTAQASNTKSTLMSIQFRTPQNGWMVGTGGTILKTTDGGKKWKRVVMERLPY